MAIKEYSCKNCEKKIERIESRNQTPLRKCPDCGKKVEKIEFSNTSFILKGSDWYKTTYK